MGHQREGTRTLRFYYDSFVKSQKLNVAAQCILVFKEHVQNLLICFHKMQPAHNLYVSFKRREHLAQSFAMVVFKCRSLTGASQQGYPSYVPSAYLNIISFSFFFYFFFYKMEVLCSSRVRLIQEDQQGRLHNKQTTLTAVSSLAADWMRPMSDFSWSFFGHGWKHPLRDGVTRRPGPFHSQENKQTPPEGEMKCSRR